MTEVERPTEAENAPQLTLSHFNSHRFTAPIYHCLLLHIQHTSITPAITQLEASHVRTHLKSPIPAGSPTKTTHQIFTGAKARSHTNPECLLLDPLRISLATLPMRPYHQQPTPVVRLSLVKACLHSDNVNRQPLSLSRQAHHRLQDL